MKIGDFFKKPIDRNIETVIKADDRDHIAEEVAEYVITKEVSKKIQGFFNAYNNYAAANGVWISGFFGSGKSHLLKILSYVLENKTFDEFESGEVFADKIMDDEMLRADVIAATKIPSESILFNIDQQAQITSKADTKAILSVFYKVFYDHLGFFGAQLHVAQFEQWLFLEGVYENFQARYLEIQGKSWKEERRKYFSPKTKKAIGLVLGEIFQDDSKDYQNIIDELRKDLTISIEDFSQRVMDYIQTKSAAFRLNFFVDEVGQYIGENTQLMLNLQTVAESLATKTKGRSWILVTSQEDMESVLGDMNRKQQNDFSRIQARFKIKIPLTSSNVDEVIEKRLLEKETPVQKRLSQNFETEKAHLETLLSFSEVGVQFKGYRDKKDFANKMPFVPYQFDLFQQCRKALSNHNAFQGKHSSVGERSMLGVFQQVVKEIKTGNDKTLVSFDNMYEGIRNELKGEIQNAVIFAEKNLGNDFAIKVLKALFLVKYFRNFKATKRNISVLLIDDINIDIKKHEEKVDTALSLLENQSYVQRNADIYEFLTDDEKDVEREIKNTPIDDQAITNLMKEVFFNEIIKDNKIKYIENKQDYDFSNKIDGILLGREKELTIEIITEGVEDETTMTAHQMQTSGSSSMKMILPSDATFMKDTRMYLKTHKYVKQNNSTSNRIEVKRILQEKGQQNAERRRNLVLIGNKLLAEATVFINASKLDKTAASDGRMRVATAFQTLIKTVHPNLRMIGTSVYTEETIKTTLRSKQDELFGPTNNALSEAESEVYTLVNRRKKQSDRTTLLDLRGLLIAKPYGWYQNAIWVIVARLYKRGKIEIKQNSNLLDDEAVLNALMKSSNYGTTLLEPQAHIDPKLVDKLKKVFADAFDQTCSFKEAKDVANNFRDKLEQMRHEVNRLQAQKRDFPFYTALDDFSDKLNFLLRKNYDYFLNNLSEFEDDLLDAKEDILDPIRRFHNGEQAKIYSSIKTMLQSDTSNFDYIEGEEYQLLKSLLDNDKPYLGNAIKDAKAAKDALADKVKQHIEIEKTTSINAISRLIEDLESKEEYQALDESAQAKITQPFQRLLHDLERQRNIARIRDIKNNAKERLFPQQLNEMVRLATPPEPQYPTNDDSGVPTSKVVKEPKPHYVNKSIIRHKFVKTELRTEQDVDDYVEALREAYKEEINKNKRITL